MKRSEATRRLEELVRRVIDGGNVYLNAVNQISLFGSYVAGAPTPNDVDILVRYSDPTGAIGDEQRDRMFDHRPITTPFEQALRGRQRVLSIHFDNQERLKQQGGFDIRPIWKRGEPLEAAVARLHAISVNPGAGSAPRQYPHPAIEGFEKRTAIEDRRRLVELTGDGTIIARRISIEREAEPASEPLRRRAGGGYSERSPRRRAMRALVARLEQEEIPVTYSDQGLLIVRGHEHPRYAIVEHGAIRLGAAIDAALWKTGRSYCVLNLSGREDFAVVEIVARQFPQVDD